jgi:hypothetical protein
MPSPWRERPISPPSDPKSRAKDAPDPRDPKPEPPNIRLRPLQLSPMRRIQGEDE